LPRNGLKKSDEPGGGIKAASGKKAMPSVTSSWKGKKKNFPISTSKKKIGPKKNEIVL